MKGFLFAGLTAVLLVAMSTTSQANWGYGGHHHHCGGYGYRSGYAYPYGAGYGGYYGAAYRPYYGPNISIGVGGFNGYYGSPYGYGYGGGFYRPYGW